MASPLTRWTFVAVLAAAAITGFAAEAGKDKEAKEPPPPPFRVSTSAQPVPGAATMTRGYIFTETNRYTFVLPQGVRMQPDVANRRVVLSPTDGSYAMSVRVVTPEGGAAMDMKPEAVRAVALGRLTGGKVLEESSVNADGRTGPSVDVQWRSATGMVITRAGYLPVTGGWLEFEYTASVDRFANHSAYFNQWILSFRVSGKDGELQMQSISPPE